jgi:hypothetical protein
VIKKPQEGEGHGPRWAAAPQKTKQKLQSFTVELKQITKLSVKLSGTQSEN